MPTTPSSVSASFTSSSLNGLMMASIFLIPSPGGSRPPSRPPPAAASLARPFRPSPIGLRRLHGFAVQRDVGPRGGLPREVLGHGVANQRAPRRAVPVRRDDPLERAGEVLDSEAVEQESRAPAARGAELADGVGEATG